MRKSGSLLPLLLLDSLIYTGQQGDEVPATASRVVIAENTTRSSDEALFKHQELEEEVNLIVPSSVREIGTPAFHAQKKLKTVVRCVLIAENITRIPAR
eukprot:scaffold7652_cov134-Cylindrotheca_fusiformis.AAC.1